MKARDNPLRTGQVLRVRYRLRGETLDDVLERMKALNYRAAIVGPKGTGKTTLLEDLGVALDAIGFQIKMLRLSASRDAWEQTWERRHPCLQCSHKRRRFTRRSFPRGFLKQFFAELTQHDVILFDGAEQMSRLEWHFFKRQSKKAGGLLITSHNPGMLPTLRECYTTPELLESILGELLGSESAEFLHATVELHQKHNGNLRDALRELYDVYAGRLIKTFE